jgi:hypothetical protein
VVSVAGAVGATGSAATGAVAVGVVGARLVPASVAITLAT